MQARTSHSESPSVFIKIRPRNKIFAFTLGTAPWRLMALRKDARVGQQVSFLPRD